MIPHLQVASYQQNSRIAFVFNTICEWYGWEWSFVNEAEFSSELRFSYGFQAETSRSVYVAEPFCISEIGTPQGTSSWSTYKEVPNPCQSDPIAGIFYLLTCAEEYTVKQFDAHSRVSAKDLSVVKNGYESIPLADRLAEVLAKAIWEAAGWQGTPEMKQASGYSSLDIDQVFALHHKPFHKKTANLARALGSGNWKAIQAVIYAILGRQDPFDQFDWLKEQHAQRQLRPLVFLLMGYENSTDQAWNPNRPMWPALVAGLRAWTEIGLHPSYYTASDSNLLREEKMRLEGLLGNSVARSRQHFLKVAWPQTFQSLVSLGITHDYTLAWPDLLGFRMGTARSCYWYDLNSDEQTVLRLHPPSMMEVTGRYYVGLSPKQFLQTAHHLREQSQRSKSGLRVIWHNSNLSELGGWGRWKSIYPAILDLIAD